jgi:cysteinyl-tRNA synthetase
MGLELYNTMGRELQPFRPLEEGKVKLYCCGPTVYDYAHIGNLRTYVFEDLLRRILERNGLEVTHVMNVTDVGHLTDDADEGEDKMLVGARKRGMSVWEIAEHFTRAFFADTAKLNILEPTIVCRATDHIDEMQSLIRELEERDLTYVADGNVYYRINAFDDYGKLALLDQQKLQAGARIAVDEGKENPHDFVLWFTKGKFEHQTMQWDSPWGRGYPGWHLECSAMSMRYLGDRIDIHCGGVDHVNVHHTNEIAQSEGAVGHEWVNYWLHGEFLIIPSGRMGKSKGNMVTLSTLEEEGFDPLDYRYFLLGAHYRTQLTFTLEALEAAKKARSSLREQIMRLAGEVSAEERVELLASVESRATLSRISADDLDSDEAREALRQIESAFRSDLNVTKALGFVRSLLREGTIPASDRLRVALDADRVFALELTAEVRGVDQGASLPAELEALVAEREQARTSRDFARADEIREKLRENGVVVEDNPGGTSWRWG